jgi:hypothetical protein
MLVCQSLFNVSGPGVPATSLLTPLRAASCSAIGQSSKLTGAVDVDVGLGEGEAIAVGVADAVGFADADADGDGLPDARDVGVAEADDVVAGDGDGELGLVTGGVLP